MAGFIYSRVLDGTNLVTHDFGVMNPENDCRDDSRIPAVRRLIPSMEI